MPSLPETRVPVNPAKLQLTTISHRSTPEVKRRLANLQLDNAGVQERKIKSVIQDKIIPLVDKLLDSRKIPAGLMELESEFKKKRLYPRSIYRYRTLYDGCHKYDGLDDWPYDRQTVDLLSDWRHPYRPSTTFSFQPELYRNHRALDKGAGLPHFGKKGEQLPYARQYVEDVLKCSRLDTISDMYSVFPNYRTQQSPPTEPKVRLVWMYPISSWYMESEALDSALDQTTIANQSDKLNIKTFYMNPVSEQRGLKSWMNAQSDVVYWMNGDASSYDTKVRTSELAAGWSYFASGYEQIQKLFLFSAYSSLVMPEGDLLRNGGMPSGSKFTNLGDGWTNVLDYLEVLKKIDLYDHCQAILVNGDDITLGFNKMIDEDILNAIAKHSRRIQNPEKTKVRDWIWNSKWYCDGEIITRPINRVLNSLMFAESRMNPVNGSKEMIEIVLAMQLHDIEQHPLGPEVIDAIKLEDKYHISGMSDEQLIAAATAYLDDHSFMVDSGMFTDVNDFIRWVRSSLYAQT